MVVINHFTVGRCPLRLVYDKTCVVFLVDIAVCGAFCANARWYYRYMCTYCDTYRPSSSRTTKMTSDVASILYVFGTYMYIVSCDLHVSDGRFMAGVVQILKIPIL